MEMQIVEDKMYKYILFYFCRNSIERDNSIEREVDYVRHICYSKDIYSYPANLKIESEIYNMRLVSKKIQKLFDGALNDAILFCVFSPFYMKKMNTKGYVNYWAKHQSENHKRKRKEILNKYKI